MIKLWLTQSCIMDKKISVGEVEQLPDENYSFVLKGVKGAFYGRLGYQYFTDRASAIAHAKAMTATRIKSLEKQIQVLSAIDWDLTEE